MERFAVYADSSPGYVVFDTLSERVVGQCSNADVVLSAAHCLNEPAGRVFRSAKDVADARVEYWRLQSRRQKQG